MLDDTVLRKAGIDTEDGLKYSGNSVELYDSVLEIFANSVEEQRRKMKDELEEEDYQAFAILAHTVKSNARTIGATELYQIALAMEKSGDNADSAYIKENWNKFIEIWDKIDNSVNEYLSHI